MGSAAQDSERPQGNGEAEATPQAAGIGAPSHPSRQGEGVLAALSTMINDNLGVFRATTATMVVGSALTVSFLVYRRGLHGFGSAAQVPASYFERRKRVRVRIAKIVEGAKPDGVPDGGHDRNTGVRGGRHPTVSPQDGGAFVGSDVLLHTEHITLPRRLLRLPPRSLLPSAGGIDTATFTLRLCGVSAAEEGVALAREELVKPLVGWYCDAELLYREQRPGKSSGLGGQASCPIAVCHIHRRRGVLWRDTLQPRLDPKAGFGEHLLSQGLAVLREEVWWAPGYTAPNSPVSGDATTEASTQARPRSAGSDAPVVRDGDDPGQPFPALKRLLEDRERFAAAEKGAELARKGVWEVTPREDQGQDKAAAGRGGGVMSTGLKRRSAAAVRAFMGFFGRGKQ